jgi:hypothetical protein
MIDFSRILQILVDMLLEALTVTCLNRDPNRSVVGPILLLLVIYLQFEKATVGCQKVTQSAVFNCQ